MTKLVDQYSYTIAFSPADGAFVGRVAEWPSLAAHGPTADAALKEIRFAVEAALEDMAEETPPEPLSRRNYSGKLLLRLPTDLHRFLAVEAEREATSLNQLIATYLATFRTGPARTELPAKKPAATRTKKKRSAVARRS
ncbi:MAG: toxin-antitoxin system HicB family antitoxin [Deltaproteobacteria bacterium]|nr:toxin-antitoxin system HicB family antitoxin [Deltaproteobacteria bacterium]